jgi:MFS transporter, FSR family, fosmidomycin resistance protein
MNPRALIALATGHFLGDSYGSFLAPLLPALIVRHGLDLRSAGLLAAVFATAANLLQPFWGLLADRWPGRRFAIAGPLLMAVCISSIGLAPNLGLLILALAVGGSGMAAFHPEAAALALKASPSRPQLGMSLFIASGVLGFAFGPLLVTGLVASFGLKGTAWGFVPGVLGSVVLLKLVPDPATAVSSVERERESPNLPNIDRPSTLGRWNRGQLLNLWAISILRALVTIGFLTFLPVLFARQGYSLEAEGRLVSVFLLASAVGAISGGYAAERLGNKRVMGITLAASAPLLWGAIATRGPLQVLALFAAGLLLTGSHAVNVSLAQSLAPHRAGTVAAFMIGVAIGIAGLLMPVMGAAADAYGVETALAGAAFSAAIASVLVIPLRA